MATVTEPRRKTAPKFQTKMLIDGKFRDSQSGKTFATINPATEEVIAQVAEGDAADIDLAVKAARKAFDSGPWRKMDARDRGRLMNKLADLIEEHIDELAELETLDNGKPIGESRGGDLPLVIDCLRYYAGWADKIHGQTIPIRGNYFCYSRREPVGVVGQIIPWNFPMLMVAWKWGPALAAGCTVVLKPAEQTPLTALRMGELAMEAGFPAGVINIVPGFGETAGAPLVAHQGVDKIAFTGESTTGKLIMKNAAETLKRVTLELGGKSPNIVFADADLDAAVDGAMLGLFLNQGQCCCAGSRLFVQDKVYDAMVEKLADKTLKRKVGDPFDPSTEQGPQIDEAQFKKILSLHRQGQGPGGPVRRRRRAARQQGLFHQADGLRRRQGRHGHRHRRDLRAGDAGAEVQGHRGGHRAGQHHRLRPGRRGLDPRHRQGPRHRRPRPRRHRLGQLLRRLRRRRPVRRLQAQRHRPRAGREGPGQLHRAQDGDGGAGVIGCSTRPPPLPPLRKGGKLK